jgi:hypothetical protein
MVMRTLLILPAVCLAAATVTASTGPNIDVGTRAKGAKKVVVATVTDVQSAFDVNDYGDRLIMSRVLLDVTETMKGPQEPSVAMTIEGGTVGDVTLSVSDMPKMTRGDRAVLFLDDSSRGGNVPHGRGLGILQLDATDHVPGTGMSLDEIRNLVKAAQAQGR